MGYSIFVPFETEIERDNMLDFLTVQFRELTRIAPFLAETTDAKESTVPYPEVSYTGDYAAPILGYDYGAGDTDIERGYRFAICYWMAVHGGRTKNGKHLMIYDGCGEWSICHNGDTCTCSATLHTDDVGYRKIQPLMLAERISEQKRLKSLTRGVHSALQSVDKAVHQELIRLSALWQSRQTKQ